ncbi:hypothetical protein [uncultured Mobiluncus sp.]|uniref:hypothetical protein n=1 Tax=uncultured Mobiluncus sp. TaxID=293425 RepID=UPI002603A901|nr:hypothetical protein [uncultured Mobiluncus sp.]
MATNNYVKLDAGFFLNPKIAPLQHAAIAAYLCSICCAKLANQDGEFQLKQILVLTDVTRDDVQPLFDYGFWEHSNIPGVAVVHDFLDWNLSRSEQEKRAESSRKNGAFGGRPTNKPTPVIDPENPEQKPTPKPTQVIDTETDPGYLPQNRPRLSTPKPTPLTDPETDPLTVKERKKEIGTPPAPPEGGGHTTTKKTKKTNFPENFQITPAHQTYAQQAGIDITLALNLFEDWAISGGKTYVDWGRAFSNALRDWLPDKVRRVQANQTGQTSPRTARIRDTYTAIDNTSNPYMQIPF